MSNLRKKLAIPQTNIVCKQTFHEKKGQIQFSIQNSFCNNRLQTVEYVFAGLNIYPTATHKCI